MDRRVGRWLLGLAFAVFFVPFMMVVAAASPFRRRRFRQFRSLASSIRPGDFREEVSGALEQAGGRPAGGAGNVSIWSRHKGPFFRVGTVAVLFDDEGRVERAVYRERPEAA